MTEQTIRRDQATRADRFAAAQRANRIGSTADVRPGDRVFVVLAGTYGTVRKARNTSVSVEIPGVDRPWSVTPRALQWLADDDLKAAAEDGRPIGPQRDDLTAA